MSQHHTKPKNHTTNLTKHVNVFKNHVINIINHDNAKKLKITEVEKFSKNHDNDMVNHDDNLMHHDTNIINHAQKTNQHVSMFKNLVPYIPMLGMLAITALVTANLRTLPSSADNDSSTSYGTGASVVVSPSCSFIGTTNEAHIANIINGQYKEDIGTTTLRTYCNDANGYKLYVMGYTNCDEDETTCLLDNNNTKLIEQDNNTLTISTGLYPGKNNLTNDTPSSWSMKLATSDTTLDLDEDYANTYHTIPSSSTLVATKPAGTSGAYKTDSSLTATYDTYINQTQPAGTYQGKVKYTMVQTGANIVPDPRIQDITLSQCKVNVGTNGNADDIGDNITVYDERDGNDYTIRYINGLCWMTQNLRFMGSTSNSKFILDSTTSNVDNIYTASSPLKVKYFDLETDSECNTAEGYNNTCVKYLHNETIGAWYNYAAATAGTIRGDQGSSVETTQDICPAGWHLPSGTNRVQSSDFNKLMGSTSAGLIDSTTGTTAFNAVNGGIWWTGEQQGEETIGSWWSRNVYGASANNLQYNKDNNQFNGGALNPRMQGGYVRCVLK